MNNTSDVLFLYREMTWKFEMQRQHANPSRDFASSSLCKEKRFLRQDKRGDGNFVQVRGDVHSGSIRDIHNNHVLICKKNRLEKPLCPRTVFGFPKDWRRLIVYYGDTHAPSL